MTTKDLHQQCHFQIEYDSLIRVLVLQVYSKPYDKTLFSLIYVIHLLFRYQQKQVPHYKISLQGLHFYKYMYSLKPHQ